MKLIERTWIVGIFWWNMQNTKPMIIIYATTRLQLNRIMNTIVVSPRYFHVWQGFEAHCLRPRSKIWSFNTEERKRVNWKKKEMAQESRHHQNFSINPCANISIHYNSKFATGYCTENFDWCIVLMGQSLDFPGQELKCDKACTPGIQDSGPQT